MFGRGRRAAGCRQPVKQRRGAQAQFTSIDYAAAKLQIYFLRNPWNPFRAASVIRASALPYSPAWTALSKLIASM